MNLSDQLMAAERAAHRGGHIVRERRVAEPLGVKGAGDYVTDVDRASERVIRDELETTGIPVLGEEEGHPGEVGDRMWVVDPLDGTANFVHGFPLVGVSIALVEQGRPVIGVVHAPFLGQTWTAVRGGGAHLDGRTVRVSERPPERAIVGTGFPFRRKDAIPRYLEVFRTSLERFEDLRRPGAAALDLAWVAEGVFEGFFELGLSSWDVAAGGLLVEEAGGVVTDWEGTGGWLSGDILAGSSAVHEELLSLARAPG
jgi:myo-inositol-1(or 4)-monophosphatase